MNKKINIEAEMEAIKKALEYETLKILTESVKGKNDRNDYKLALGSMLYALECVMERVCLMIRSSDRKMFDALIPNLLSNMKDGEFVEKATMKAKERMRQAGFEL